LHKFGNIALFAALIVFAAFLTNVLAGAFWNASFLSDVGEMLTLLLTSIFFVAAIISFENRDRSKSGKE
jgi:uncharacterized membrane protein (DUF485 family)